MGDTTRITRCLRCGKSIRATAANPWRPFCSERCKTVDLGGWLDERHRIPGEPQADTRPENGEERQD